MTNTTTTTTTATQVKEISLTACTEFGSQVHNKDFNLYVMASLKAMNFEPETKRAPVNIVCIIDNSGSMSGAKIGLVKRTLLYMVDQLKDEDRLSVIQFNSSVKVLFNMTSMNADSKHMAQSVINSIYATGGTNLSGGLLAGYEQVTHFTQPTDVTSILLFTDGEANEGIRDPQALSEQLRRVRTALPQSTSLFTFGYGADHNSNLLRDLSEIGGGIYYYLQDIKSIVDSFSDCLGGLLSNVANKISLKIELLGQNTITKVLSTSYTTKQDSEMDEETGAIRPVVTMTIGDMYSEEQKDIVFVLNVRATRAPEEKQPLVRFVLSYESALDKCHKTSFYKLSIPRTDPSDTEEITVNILLDKQRNRVEAAAALSEARQIADTGNLEKAREVLTLAAQKIRGSASAADPLSVGLLEDLNNCLNRLTSYHDYSTVGNKLMNNYYMSNMQQRSTNADTPSQMGYQNVSKQQQQQQAQQLLLNTPITSSMLNTQGTYSSYGNTPLQTPMNSYSNQQQVNNLSNSMNAMHLQQQQQPMYGNYVNSPILNNNPYNTILQQQMALRQMQAHHLQQQQQVQQLQQQQQQQPSQYGYAPVQYGYAPVQQQPYSTPNNYSSNSNSNNYSNNNNNNI